MASLDHAKQMERMLDVSSALGSKSSAMSRSLMETLRQGQALSEFATRATEMVSPVVPDRPRIDFGELARLDAESKWVPFEYLGDKLDRQSEQVSELTAGVSKLANYAVQTNETQTLIAEETRRAAEDSRTSANRNLLINVCVLLVTLASLSVSVVALVRSTPSQTATPPPARGTVEQPGKDPAPTLESVPHTAPPAATVSSSQVVPDVSSGEERAELPRSREIPKSPSVVAEASGWTGDGKAVWHSWLRLTRLPEALSRIPGNAEMLLEVDSPAQGPTMSGENAGPRVVEHK